jgi:putative endonuclease
MSTNHARRGALAEMCAAKYLQQCGFVIVARNFRCRAGELDIVARRHRLLVIAEVRLRSDCVYGSAAESVTRAKRDRIRRAARFLLRYRRSLQSLSVRFDTLTLERVDGPIDWIEDAFS